MGKKKNKMKKDENVVPKDKNAAEANVESNKVRSSEEIEDEDGVVHDEQSPRPQKTVTESEFTEITNVLETKSTVEIAE